MTVVMIDKEKENEKEIIRKRKKLSKRFKVSEEKMAEFINNTINDVQRINDKLLDIFNIELKEFNDVQKSNIMPSVAVSFCANVLFKYMTLFDCEIDRVGNSFIRKLKEVFNEAKIARGIV